MFSYWRIKMYLKPFIASLLIINVCLGMNDSEKPVKDTSMTEINTWQDLAPFALRIIAYKSDSSYINCNKNYKFDKKDTIQFGVVSEFPMTWKDGGYDLHQLIQGGALAVYCYLTNREISEGLAARLANKDETVKIYAAIRNDKARFQGLPLSAIPDFRDPHT